ncbi:hypothetical protein E4U53_003939, partial [Claviceps sorghi]
MWSCDDCLMLRFGAEDKANYDLSNRSGSLSKLGDQLKQIRENDKLDHELRNAMVKALFMKEEYSSKMMWERRIAQLEETQSAEQWASDYGSAVFELLYPSHGQQDLADTTNHQDEAGPVQGEQAEQDDAKGEDDENDHDMAQDEEDEANTPSAGEPRTREELTMFLNLLLSTKDNDTQVLQDASGFCRETKGQGHCRLS